MVRNIDIGDKQLAEAVLLRMQTEVEGMGWDCFKNTEWVPALHSSPKQWTFWPHRTPTDNEEETKSKE
jgi:hypothetical protein